MASERPSDGRQGHMIVVSNRLPLAFSRNGDGGWNMVPGSGGLVTALLPVLRNRGGVWIGWPGTTEPVPGLGKLLNEATRRTGYRYLPVPITARENDEFYLGYSNACLWPLFHDLLPQCVFAPEWWQSYVGVNRKYAEAVIRTAGPDDFVWLHDYQLMYAPQALRELGFEGRVAFFLHIPFPSPDIFMKLPERSAVLRALLKADLVGFQTQRDHRNFVQCVRTLVPHARVRFKGHVHIVKIEDRDISVGAFPIGIDYRRFTREARSRAAVAWRQKISGELDGRQIVFGVDRLDYTKGIPQRLQAFRQLLLRHPEVHSKVNLVEVVIPSRIGIPKYDALKVEIERLVGEINGQFTRAGWVPIHYIFRSLEFHELLGYYSAADVGLVTPLKDGMNLVAKEYCACTTDLDGVLVLSEFAGAAAQLGRNALTVNPNDVVQTAEAIYDAISMPRDERRSRMRRLRRSLKAHDVFWWVDSFVRAATEKDLRDFPLIEDYVPELEES
jgi:trehalose 6-phosphate synthase/phosphatase